MTSDPRRRKEFGGGGFCLRPVSQDGYITAKTRGVIHVILFLLFLPFSFLLFFPIFPFYR